MQNCDALCYTEKSQDKNEDLTGYGILLCALYSSVCIVCITSEMLKEKILWNCKIINSVRLCSKKTKESPM